MADLAAVFNDGPFHRCAGPDFTTGSDFRFSVDYCEWVQHGVGPNGSLLLDECGLRGNYAHSRCHQLRQFPHPEHMLRFGKVCPAVYAYALSLICKDLRPDAVACLVENLKGICQVVFAL